MSEALIMLVSIPDDYSWALELARQLEAENYEIYLEPPHDDDPTIQRQTAAALHNAQVMLAIISKESALGESATTFEAWWRPFMQKGKRVIACIMPDAPPGAEHWMPYDLMRQTHINFRDEDAFEQLTLLLPAPPPLLAAPLPESTISSQQTSTPKTDPPPIKVGPSSVRNALNILVGLVLVMVLWLAALEATDLSMALWLAVLFVVVVSLFLLSRIAFKRRERLQNILARRQAAAARDTSQPIYLEVIESKFADEIGQIWGISDGMVLIGKNHKADIPLRDRQLDLEHCIVFADNDRFYLENVTRRRTVLYGRKLTAGETIELQNGDLISLGQSTVVQLRVNQPPPPL